MIMISKTVTVTRDPQASYLPHLARLIRGNLMTRGSLNVHCRFGLPRSLLASSQARKLLSSTHLQSGAVQYCDCGFAIYTTAEMVRCMPGTPYSADVPGTRSQVHGLSSPTACHHLSLHALTLAQHVSPISSRHLCVETFMDFEKIVIQHLMSPIAVWVSYVSSTHK